MSRIIVKNLPKNVTESSLRSLFSEKGAVTDVQLKYTADGVFRQFAFIGYETEEKATEALQYFNRSTIQTNRITVELCETLGSSKKPKAWSKYSADSSAYKTVHSILSSDKKAEKPKVARKKIDERVDEILGDHKDDPKFLEFLDAHNRKKEIWKNDLQLKDDDDGPKKAVADKTPNDDEISDTIDEDKQIKLADQEISDAEYMKSLLQKSTTKTKSAATDSSEKSAPKLIDLLTIKIRNIPYKTKRQDVLNFFKPNKPYSVRLPTKIHGICYVGFKKETDFQKALLKNRSIWNGKQILMTDFTKKKEEPTKDGSSIKKNPKWAKQEDSIQNEEDISESGRIFFRNLSYGVKEEDLREIFEKFGPIADITLPVDPMTMVIKGFGTVTFVMPEHAVKAFNDLDGTIFHGRLFHLIPGKSKNEDDDNLDGLSFASKKLLKKKKTAGSSHNWNTLFLGGDAVANLLSKHYGTSKEHVLGIDGGGSSAAARLALGETEIILQMKRFLENNGVCLNVFDDVPKERSNTVIIAKNLPINTTVKELQLIFSKFGLLGRIVLPPSGVTALIEFTYPTEARCAFKKLAYSKFKNLPLYLEWAPENTFKSSAQQIESLTDKIIDSVDEKPTEKENSTEINASDDTAQTIEDDTTAPELGTTLFLRNLNFSTREPAIREHFQSYGAIHMIQVAMKKDPSSPDGRTSLGYGFIQFKKKAIAEKVLIAMQTTQIEGNKVELKRSDRILQSQVKTTKRQTTAGKQTGAKILVRNIPFQAKQQEVREIFRAFGELKTLRLPKKMSLGVETHRGFGFVEFFSESDAKKAFDSLCQSTHLYNRRLVLEWAAADEGIDELRKRTAEHFHGTIKKIKRNTIFDPSNIKMPDED